MLQVLQDLYNRYTEVQFKNRNRYFNHNSLLSELEILNSNSEFDSEIVGQSELGLDIYKVRFGKGPLKIMAWSQMHGNEATGTLALLELYHLLLSKPLHNIWEEISFVSIVMVNPDGANLFTRRNGCNVDLNRDAVARVAVETQLLIKQIELEKPDFALNLHDQRNIFGVSGSETPATISFLAPSYNVMRQINSCREKCMLLISALSCGVKEEIGDYVAKYNDEFYPTAFGELVQSMGIPCVLIESGGHPNDDNREVSRKMNVYSILKMFSIVIDNGWKKRVIKEYVEIPENNTHFFDLILKSVKFKMAERIVEQDLGLLIQQSLQDGTLVEKYVVQDFGDLSFKYALESIDVSKDTAVYDRFDLNTKLDAEWRTINLHFKDGIRQ